MWILGIVDSSPTDDVIVDSSPTDDVTFRQKARVIPHVKVIFVSLHISADGGRA